MKSIKTWFDEQRQLSVKERVLLTWFRFVINLMERFPMLRSERFIKRYIKHAPKFFMNNPGVTKSAASLLFKMAVGAK